MKQVTSTEANRDFSKLLQRVAGGEAVQITSHGRPIAVMVPATSNSRLKQPAVERLLARLQAQPATGEARGWTRGDLYE